MRARSSKQEQARFTWLTPRQWGERTGTSANHVRALVASGWFRHEDAQPECIDVSLPGSKQPEYRLSPASLERWFSERAQKGNAA